MGAVYKARQPLLNRLVALKVMSDVLAEDREFIERFKREATTAAQLKHPNIVRVYAAGESNGIHYMAMEFVEGRTLGEHIRSHGRLDPQEAIAITIYVAEGLKYAWNKSRLIHRDIKPDNIFLSKAGEVVVGDMGLAKSLGGGATEMTSTGMTVGSPHYISPEQAMAAKEIDFRADIYSLGCTLFHMLTGRTPYDGNSSLEIVMKHVNDPPPQLMELSPQCPKPLGRLVDKMMAKNRDERHQSYEELIANLFAVTDTTALPQSTPTVALPSPGDGDCEPTQRVSQAQATPCTIRSAAPKTKSSTAFCAVAGAAMALVLGGLWIWPPWNKPSVQNRNTPSLQHSISSADALKQLGSVFTNSVGAEMVYIPPGEFMMGSTKEERAREIAEGAKEEFVRSEGQAPHKATIKQGFWMGRTEVTVGQWKQFVSATGYMTEGEKRGQANVLEELGRPYVLMKGKSWKDPNFGGPTKENDAISCISWNDAVAYCAWLTKQERKAGRLLVGFEVRLPTEAEWEHACRAGTQTRFWWGDSNKDDKGRLNRSGKDDGYEFVAPVDSYGGRGRNGFGLADMGGNVWEWCLDEYDTTQAHEECYWGNPGSRPLRGGSFTSGSAGKRCAARRGCNLDGSHSDHGFRVCYGLDAAGMTAVALKATKVLAPVESRAPALTTHPKAGEVYTLAFDTNMTIELLGIPPGEFMLGSTKEEQAWANANGCDPKFTKYEGEAPRKAMIQHGFWMGRTEVTLGQWKQFVKETGYVTNGERSGASFTTRGPGQKGDFVKGANWKNPLLGFQLEDHYAVGCISWSDAMAFCRWLTTRERKAGRLPAEHVVRLPTEAEWEYACRAGMQTKFWWGEGAEDGKGRLSGAGKSDGFEYVAPADHFGAQGRNRFGLADMLGNVREWCLDDFDPAGARGEVYRGNPSGRAMRGGMFLNPPASTRCASREVGSPTSSNYYHGFRVVVGGAR